MAPAAPCGAFSQPRGVGWHAHGTPARGGSGPLQPPPAGPAHLWTRFKRYVIRTLSSYLNPNETRHIPGTFDMRPRRPASGLYGPFGIRGETILLLAVIAAVIACLVLSTLLVKTVWASIRTDAASAEPVPTQEAAVVVPAVPKKQINILLIGIDQRPDDASFRTDVMLLVNIDPNNSKVRVVSFPRDLWVQVPSLYEMKINEVMQMGGWEALAGAYQAQSLASNRIITSRPISTDLWILSITAAAWMWMRERV